MFTKDRSPFVEAVVMSVDMKRKICKCKSRAGTLLNDVGWAAPVGQSRENGDNYAPLPGETVYLMNINGELIIFFSKTVPHFDATTRATLGSTPAGSGFMDDYNPSPLPGSARGGGSTPEEQVPGDRLITNDRGSLFGLLRSGTFIAKASAMAQIFLSRIDNVVRVVFRNLELYGESKTDVSVNAKGRLYSFRGFFKNKDTSIKDTPDMYEAEGDVAAALAARDDYLNTDLSEVAEDDVVKTRVIPLYDDDGSEIGQRYREVLQLDGLSRREAYSEDQAGTAKETLKEDEWKMEVVGADGTSYQHIHPTEILLSCNGTVVATFNGAAGELTLHADTKVKIETETAEIEATNITANCTNLDVTAETSTVNSTTTNITSTTTHTGNLTVNGLLTIAGGIAASPGPGGGSADFTGMSINMTGGGITTDQDVVAGVVSLATHRHTSATAGNPTSTPIP